ncbi:MAG: hypothetical protein IKI21_11555 [Oscillospiraceae bacterium]|jgi:hypothetical protein|nr:hypothetical protein [Oscillospiraceae bacterium]
MICKAALPSETYAQKAQRTLAAHGYRAEIVRRTDRREGCSFLVRTAGDCERIHQLLIREGVPVRTVAMERDGP